MTAILVTRPQHQAQPLCDAIQQSGCQAIHLPVIDIHPVDIDKSLKDNISPQAIVIFLSANAVNYSRHLWQSLQSLPPLFAIGPGTAAAMQQARLPISAMPQDYSSEGLLHLLQDIRGKTIYICCGVDPRPLLRDQLSQHNTVIPVICYTRQAIKATAHSREILAQPIDYVVTTSQMIIQSFHQMLLASAATHLLLKPLVIVHKRHQQLARELGFQQILIAASAQSHDILQVILAHRDARMNHSS